MFEIVYFSSAKPDINSSTIHDIVVSAQQWNSENDITGSLIYCNGEFLQILEGEKKVVLALFEKIKRDNRHENVILLAAEEADKRLFPKWNMAYSELNSDEEKKKIFQDKIASFSEIVEKPNLALELFWTMAKHIVG